jgi:PAS domain S-box-containing protein
MSSVSEHQDLKGSIASRAHQVFLLHQTSIHGRTDRLFVFLLLFQWLGGIALAFWVSPLTWAGLSSTTHPHVWTAVLLGGTLITLPIYLAVRYPGRVLTRHTIAVVQMLYSALLIHLTGGRIETHFHVFGSLAFLAFYRDWRVIITGTVVVALDHVLRGFFWPQSAYGVLSGAEWRWLEHAGWVIFEDVFLIQACVQGVREMKAIAERQARLEATNEYIEAKVFERTAELNDRNEDLHRLAQRFQESEERFRHLITAAGDAIVSINEQGVVSEFNRAAEKLFGYSREEILGKPLTPLMPGRFRESHKAGLEDFMRSGERRLAGWQNLELFGITREGREFPLEASLSLFEAGNKKFVTGVLRDITVRKQVEETLKRAKEAAESANRAKSEFLANMSHEIRTPMNGIVGMTELALDTDLTPEQREYLQMVKVSADALLRVINDILDFSKIEAGKLDIESVDFGLRDLLGKTLRMLSQRAFEKGLELAQRVHTEVPDCLVGDPVRLRQVLINLLGNGIKFTEHGEVAIDIETESQAENEVCLHFIVSDTGIGIPADKQSAIFEAFAQADGSVTRRYGGTGLGLSISSQLVTLMGGRIWVESADGQGSKFHFTARFGRGLPQRTPILSPVPIRLRELPVLVVDDNALNRRILREMLSNWGMKPTEVDSGEAALAALREAVNRGTPYRLVLLDVMMPEMDGFAVAERIREQVGFANPTIMMLSSADPRDEISRCRKLGVASYLLKPIVQADLLDSVISALHLSICREPTNEPPKLAPDLPACSARKVLLAEDNAVNQKLALRILGKRGHRVTVVSNGREALAALGRESFDVIVMDLHMPEMGGIEATISIREREQLEGGHIPIIAMTACALKEDRERCEQAGMDGYISKPIKSSELIGAVETMSSPDQARSNYSLTRAAQDETGELACAGQVQDRE